MRERSRTAGADDERDERGDRHEHDRDREPRREPPPQPDLRRPAARKCNADRTDDKDCAEDEPVSQTRCVRLTVVRNPGKREPDARDDSRKRNRGDERGERIQTITLDDEPRNRRDDGERNAEAREREHVRDKSRVQQKRSGHTPLRGEPKRERHGAGREQRKLVPILERPAQPSEARVTVVEREDLCAEGDDECQAEQCGERFADPRARNPAEQSTGACEREVHEPAIRVIPRTGGLDRPVDRDRLPDDERGGEREERDALTRQNGGPQDPSHAGQEQSCGTEPEEPRVTRAVAEESRGGDEGGDRGGERHSAYIGPPHRRAKLTQDPAAAPSLTRCLQPAHATHMDVRHSDDHAVDSRPRRSADSACPNFSPS